MKKNIEKVEKTIVEEVVTYVSTDGKVFKTEEDCKKWEDSYKCVETKTWDEMLKTKAPTTELGIPYANDDCTTFVVVPKTEADITALNLIAEQNDTYGVSVFNLNDIGKKFIMLFGWFCRDDMLFSSDYVEIYDMVEHLKYINKVYADLESKIENANSESEVK